MSARFGSKIVLGVAILMGSILTLVTPVLSKWNYNALIVCRVLIGLAHVIFQLKKMI